LLLLEILLAAYRAAGDFLFLLSQEKEAKEGNPATRVPLGFATQIPSGQPAVLDHTVGRRTRGALAALRLNNYND
jgi:hypothetical protein